VTFRIQEATDNDIELLARLIRQSFRDVAAHFQLTPENCPTHPSNCQPEWIAADLNEGKTYFIMMADNIPCGCVAVQQPQPDIWDLERLAILPEYRRQGLGKTLVEYVLHETGRCGGKQVHLALIADHVKLRRWYEKLGFRVMQTRRYPKLPFAVTFMSKSL